MPMRLPVPYYTKADIRACAARFLAEHGASGRPPVDIERIAEIGMGIGMDPIPGLERDFGVVACISSDFRSVSVDEFVFSHRIRRYRF